MNDYENFGTNPFGGLDQAGTSVAVAAMRRLGVHQNPPGILPDDATNEHFETLEKNLRRLGSEGINEYVRAVTGRDIANQIIEQRRRNG